MLAAGVRRPAYVAWCLCLIAALDEITITLPPGWQVASLPEARTHSVKAAEYSARSESRSDSVQLTRHFASNVSLVQPTDYEPLRAFFKDVRTADDDGVIVAPR